MLLTLAQKHMDVRPLGGGQSRGRLPHMYSADPFRRLRNWLTWFRVRALVGGSDKTVFCLGVRITSAKMDKIGQNWTRLEGG